MKGRVVLALATLLAAASAQAALPVYTYSVVNAYPHDPGAFTEGLLYRNGYLYESTGLEGASSVRKVELKTGKVLNGAKLPRDIFGEGITDWGDKLIGLTWKTQVGFVLDIEGFALKGRFDYPGEGWGLTHNATELVMSDGTAELRVLDPDTLKEKRRIKVTAEGKPIDQLNELEWVDGEIFANIWQTDRIARIDPRTGRVTGWIDLSGLLPEKERAGRQVDVLNGIAYDPATQRLFVTGKLWPKLYEIRLRKR